VSWADISAHLIAAGLPLLLFGTYALFRRFYLRALEGAIYAPPSAPLAGTPAATLPATSALVIRWADARTWANRAEMPAAADARREHAAARRAYAIAGALFVLLGGVLVYYGLWLDGMSPRAAVVIADLNTFVGLALVLMFVRPKAAVAVAVIAMWIACYFALTVGVVQTRWNVAGQVLISNVPVTMSLPLVLIGPFALRTMRPLVVAFVPVVALVIMLTTAVVFTFEWLELPVVGQATPRAALGGAAAFVLGVMLTVRRIRRGISGRFVAGWLSALAVAVLALWVSGSLWLAFAAGVFINGTFVLVSWALLRVFLRLKARGRAPSETLHYTGCWLLYAAALAPAARVGWRLLPALVSIFVIYVVTLHALLLHGRRSDQTPRRMLLLRVFRQTPIRSWLMDLLDDTWRRIGRIDTVVGLDLALHTLNALALEDFLLGRVRRQFLKNRPEVHERIAALPSMLAVDRRYPLNELHCLPETWQPAVTALLDHADVVLIDLRGLRRTNRGVLYELTLALRRVPLARLVVLADARTNASLVADAAHGAWTGPIDGVATESAESTLDILMLDAPRAVNARAVCNAVYEAAGA
jgi:hypothetical protein